MAKLTFGRIARAALAVSALLGAQLAMAEVVAGDYIKLNTSPNGNLAGAFSGKEVNATGTALAGENSFYTFCLEYKEYFNTSDVLLVGNVLNETTNATSSFYTTNNPLSGGTTNSDPLSSATEWLFTEFSTNSTIRSSVLSSNGTANSFQRAIWYLEYELTGDALTAYNSDTVAQSWVSSATTKANGGWIDSGNQVRVLNLMRKDSNGQYSINAQDQIYFVSSPVPEVETYAMMLAGLGLMGAIARRRKAKAA